MNVSPVNHVKYLPEILLNEYGKLSQPASLEQTVNKVESVRLYLWTQCQAMFEVDFYMAAVHYMNIAFDDDFDENQVRFRPLEAAAGLCQSRPE